MTVLHGYPASVGVALLAAAGVVAATAVSWRVLGPRPSRTVSRATVVVAVAALVTGTGLAVAPHAAPAGVTANPTGDWVTQQARNLLMNLDEQHARCWLGYAARH